MSVVQLALMGTLFTFAATILGSATIFFFRKSIPPWLQRAFLGFAAGVMIAASVWSLLLPSIELAEKEGFILPWLPAAGGFITGTFFMLLLDWILPRVYKSKNNHQSLARTTVLVLAVTLHNIPEGLAVGLAFALAEQSSAIPLSGAVTLTLGMALQNFPEGAAVSLPLKKEGMSHWKSFWFGAFSGVVEPIAGVTGVLIAGTITEIMPWLLSFAAGAMVYVAVEDLIPEAHTNDRFSCSTLWIMLGFLLMMVLDIALA